MEFRISQQYTISKFRIRIRRNVYVSLSGQARNPVMQIHMRNAHPIALCMTSM